MNTEFIASNNFDGGASFNLVLTSPVQGKAELDHEGFFISAGQIDFSRPYKARTRATVGSGRD